ncbi:hypothetical protein IE077_000624 [Cardiosporidium cionae]|uniref:Peptidase M3A/M3B catalytic domain-containing protein n=1 Tax=Cardiosporidium cionae TaxID=476202 RepID=A0ABQ7JEJ8_9APIC|nr:hypothetical protein IE077_000624 [Cardiosporidium cionae]|eukprot:KAF8822401.1 hypothetical protein IE077_000624 [Cardiosporidium cionae]
MTNAFSNPLNSSGPCDINALPKNIQANERRLPLSEEPETFPTGLLELPHVQNPKDLAILAGKTVDASEKLLHQLTNSSEPSSQEMVQVLDAISNVLCKVGDAAELLRNVHPEEKWRSIATQVIDEITILMGRANVDKKLYEILQSLKEKNGDVTPPLNHEEKTVLENMCVSMEQQGVTMEEGEKETYLSLISLEGQLTYQISQFPSNQGNGIWIDRSLLMESGIPANEIAEEVHGKMYSFNPFRNNKIWISADSSLGHMALQSIKDSSIRQDLYELQQKTSPKAEKRMVELLNYRQNLAAYRGYENWNTFSQREGILQSPLAVKEFLTRLLESLTDGIYTELSLLQEYKQKLGFQNETLQPWDLLYLKASYRQNAFGNCLESLQKYLSVHSVLEGMQRILYALFGLSLERELPKNKAH